ncbi:acyl-CoA ligase (AMP-forming), exosortase A system-associated [Halopseudomonas yangmingensis]|uniref:Acyl-CoA ligase (AMP-forming), exosortase A-associated n=1 Tax=Halopseudomonas yangmingensis TaxID=1720063 RepID=A0A1I4ST34_9GAMM|nr:acyl-CoA ligase (AMP-forming), exosortase A system-associated [Halopseudomonas yangmingensis]SFM67656.1 acyl-CoA ligase (AMP-forming), exosortase A-associated [Halopseudomonas yangmingensis]
MLIRLHQLLEQGAARSGGQACALLWRDQQMSYTELLEQVELTAGALQSLGLQRGQRLAVWLPKQFQTVVALFAGNRADAVIVPINPQLKPAQVLHILRDAGVSWLVSSAQRVAQLGLDKSNCPALEGVILCDRLTDLPIETLHWDQLPRRLPAAARTIDTDLAALLYTSGSTGLPKGVMLSQRNLLCGAMSVSQYLQLQTDDRLLALLPLSFDYGLSQLTCSFYSGASVVLMDYLLPAEVVRTIARHQVTGLAGVPPLWQQLASQDWPEQARCLRFFTNSGGHLPTTLLQQLRQLQPQARPYLMYGLTEAFRSTWVPPEWLERKTDSIGIAIPNAEILVLREDGRPCADGEEGELVHRGSLVAMGYWNDPLRTAERFRPLPGQPGEHPLAELAVWSGDRVVRDSDGFMYYRGRRDEQIKCSGMRVSPEEIEHELLASGKVEECVVVGADHPQLGQAPIALLCGDRQQQTTLQQWLQRRLPQYMQPQAWIWYDQLPRNNNGKYDRPALRRQHADQFRNPS